MSKKLRRVSALFAAALLPVVLGAPAARADDSRAAQWPIAFLNLPQAWKTTKGAGITVAVLDTGVVGTRADLTGQVTNGPDFVGGREKPGDPDWGVHGTGMASVIAGHGHGAGNNDGIMGVAPAAKILSVRVIRDDESPDRGLAQTSLTPISEGIRYAVDHGAQVISMSLGGYVPGADSDDTHEADAVRYAIAHGVSVVASAGNSGEHPDKDVTEYPAGERGVIGVAAVDSHGRRAPFSSTGWDVAVAAPGVDIPMVLPIDDPSGATYADFGPVIGASTLVGAGTSPACAYVAGVVALVRSANPALSPQQVAEIIKSTTSHRPSGGRDDFIGNGIVDPVAALKAATQASGKPATVSPVGYQGPQYFGYGAAVMADQRHSALTDNQRDIANAVIALTASLLIGGWLLVRGRGRARMTFDVVAWAQQANAAPFAAPMAGSTPFATPTAGAWPAGGAGSMPNASPVAGPTPFAAPTTAPTPMATDLQTGFAPHPPKGADHPEGERAPAESAPASAAEALEVNESGPKLRRSGEDPPAGAARSGEDPPTRVDPMTNFEGRTLAPSAFPNDTGAADPALLGVLEAHGRGEAQIEHAYGYLLNARVLAPIVAILGEAEEVADEQGRNLRRDKNSDMALVTLVAPDGTRALPVFTSVEALAAWNPQARPMPVAFPRACAAAKAENAEIVLVDLGRPSFLEVEPAAVRAFAAVLEQAENQENQENQENKENQQHAAD